MVMTESIFNSIKHMLGIEPEYTHFDNDILAHINTEINILAQMGVGEDGYFIEGPSETWSNWLGENYKYAQMVKTCIYNRVRLLFDPPLNSSVSTLMKENLTELEWRLKIALDREKEVENGPTNS
jgi:hypothetical protein